MHAVADRAVRARGTMYHHFRGREELIAALQLHLDERLAHLFAISKTPSRNDYLMVAGLMVDSPELIRSFLSRLLAGQGRSDPLVEVARSHYQEVEALNWLQPGIDKDHAAVISLAMWFAAMLAVDLKTDPVERRAEANRFAATFQQVMERAIIRPEAERDGAA
jgi:AcrR family transcriptional regulator